MVQGVNTNLLSYYTQQSKTKQIEQKQIQQTTAKNLHSEAELQKQQEKRLKIALACMAVAGLIILKLLGKKKPQKEDLKKLTEIKFDNGIATLKETGEKFSGIIKDKLNNGKCAVLEYKNGTIQSSYILKDGIEELLPPNITTAKNFIYENRVKKIQTAKQNNEDINFISEFISDNNGHKIAYTQGKENIIKKVFDKASRKLTTTKIKTENSFNEDLAQVLKTD